MSDAAWLIGWGAMLLVLHLIIAVPALALLWWLRKRGVGATVVTARIVPAAIAGLLVSPALLAGHFPLLLPFALAYFASEQLGVTFSPWNLAPAALTAAVVCYFWPMRSSSALLTDVYTSPLRAQLDAQNANVRRPLKRHDARLP